MLWLVLWLVLPARAARSAMPARAMARAMARAARSAMPAQLWLVLCYRVLCYAIRSCYGSRYGSCYAIACYSMLSAQLWLVLCYGVLCYAIRSCYGSCYAIACYAMLSARAMPTSFSPDWTEFAKTGLCINIQTEKPPSAEVINHYRRQPEGYKKQTGASRHKTAD